MLIIITNSMDGTTDLLLPLIRRKKEVFRYNVDLWSEYKIEISPKGFSISDPTGRHVNQDSCSGLYLRKPYFLDEDRHKPAGGDLETWCQYQTRSMIDGVYWICDKNRLVRLVERNAERRLPKVAQMRIASAFFFVPQWIVTSEPCTAQISDPVICKPLTSAFVGDFRSLFATSIQIKDLDPGYPWLIQRHVDSDGDLTVVYVAGKTFPFFRKKREGEPVDYREVEDGQTEGWERAEIPLNLEVNIQGYMKQVHLTFGRIDFLIKGEDYYFLEVNPNGQFAWLDPDDKTGLLSCIAEHVAA